MALAGGGGGCDTSSSAAATNKPQKHRFDTTYVHTQTHNQIQIFTKNQ
jgi:hypothetical protein